MSEKNVLVIVGTSRQDGNTAKIIADLIEGHKADVIFLNEFEVGMYNYNAQNAHDDFKKISLKMIEAKTIVFATPVYWYAMSAQMKTLFDRLSDLITIRKEEGRALAGKNIFVFANGSDHDIPEGFTIPFVKTCEYFDMNYKDCLYINISNRNDFVSCEINKRFKDQVFV